MVHIIWPPTEASEGGDQTVTLALSQTIIKRRLRQIAKDIEQIDEALRNLSDLDATFGRKVVILKRPAKNLNCKGFP